MSTLQNIPPNPSLMERCDLLNKEIEEKKEERVVLENRLNKIFEEAVQGGNSRAKALVVSMVVKLHSDSGGKKSVSFSENTPLEVRLGTFNQYNSPDRAGVVGKGNNACTSCAQCFLARALTWGGARDLSPDEIDDILKDGISNYELIRQNSIDEHTANRSIPFYETFSHAETKDMYGLEHVACEGEVSLERDQSQSTALFFEAELIKLKQRMQEEGHGFLGGILHAQGKTYALAIYHYGDHFEYVLFDSHGHESNSNNNAYVWMTQNQEQMAQGLSQLVPYIQTLILDISAKEKEAIEERDNVVILYIVKTNEHAALPRGFSESLSSSSNEEENKKIAGELQDNVGDHPEKTSLEKEKEKTLSIVGRIFAFLAIAATCIAFWFRDHIVSVFTSVAQKIFAPSPTLLEKIQ